MFYTTANPTLVPIDFDRKLAFIHVPKTAGVSITRGLTRAGADLAWADGNVESLFAASPNGEIARARMLGIRPDAITDAIPQNHLPAVVARDLLGQDVWESLFSFALVRNPWERIVSAYHYQLPRVADTNLYKPKSTWATLLAGRPDFETFALRYGAAKLVPTMADMICDEHRTPIVSFVGRFETLANDIAAISQRTGLQIQLPHDNASVHKSYREYYTPTALKAVDPVVGEDAELFGYRF